VKKAKKLIRIISRFRSSFRRSRFLDSFPVTIPRFSRFGFIKKKIKNKEIEKQFLSLCIEPKNMSKYKMFRRRIFPISGRVVVGQYFWVFWANPLATRTRPSIRAENRTRLDLIHHRMASFSFHDHRLGHLDLHQRHSPAAASPVITSKTKSTPALGLFTRH
jgi:hypothetical protein